MKTIEGLTLKKDDYTDNTFLSNSQYGSAWMKLSKVNEDKSFFHFNLGPVQGKKLEGEILCPIVINPHPMYEELKSFHINYCIEKKIIKNTSTHIEKFLINDFPLLAVNCYPYCDFEQLKIACEWLLFLFCYDDNIDVKDPKYGKTPQEVMGINKHISKVLRGKEKVNENFNLSLISESIRSHLNKLKISTKAFLDSVDRYLEANVIAAHKRDINLTFSEHSAMFFRDYLGAVETTTEIGLLLKGVTPGNVRKNLIFQSIYTLANRVICHANDIFSLKKEIKEDVLDNMVLVKQYEDSTNLEQAFFRVLKSHNSEMKSYLELIQYLPKEKIYEEFVEVLNAWIWGNLDWSLSSKRFK